MAMAGVNKGENSAGCGVRRQARCTDCLSLFTNNFFYFILALFFPFSF